MPDHDILRMRALSEARRALASDLGEQADRALELGIPEATAAGVEDDDDMVWVVAWRMYHEPMAKAFLIVGRTILTGKRAVDYVIAYCDEDPESAHEMIDTIAHDAADMWMESGGLGGFFLNHVRDSESDGWRSFRGVLPTAAEVLARHR